ncbi:MAG: hypothetical protein PSV17_04100 [Methylotenera sp.]|uniref:hypothetical protein n=1 Tax=Methylotenera sp. TaxID=2051956 RepID=UPI0024899B26|nr:hypothetical protein [Methylotenera sp.]MDI1308601.1 hypothetical protein [Methylotenera sp.]
MAETLHSTEKVSVAALISVILRRKISRTIDIKWFVENEAYATHIIALCREQGLTDLNEYVDRFEIMMFGKLSTPIPIPEKFSATKNDTKEFRNTLAPSFEEEVEDLKEVIDPHKYVGGIR